MVRPGDVLTLTPKEAESVKSDPRFLAPTAVNLTRAETARTKFLESLETERSIGEETNRRAALAEQCAEERVEALTVNTMTRAELLDLCAATRSIDPTFSFNPRWETARLLKAVRSRRHSIAKNPGADGETFDDDEGVPVDESPETAADVPEPALAVLTPETASDAVAAPPKRGPGRPRKAAEPATA